MRFGLPPSVELAFPKPDPETELFLRLENVLFSTLMAAFHVSELKARRSKMSSSRGKLSSWVS